MSSAAYSLASSGLWIEHGPTITTSLSDFPESTSATSARADLITCFARSDRGTSDRSSAGERSGSIFSIGRKRQYSFVNDCAIHVRRQFVGRHRLLGRCCILTLFVRIKKRVAFSSRPLASQFFSRQSSSQVVRGACEITTKRIAINPSKSLQLLRRVQENVSGVILSCSHKHPSAIVQGGRETKDEPPPSKVRIFDWGTTETFSSSNRYQSCFVTSSTSPKVVVLVTRDHPT